MKTKDPLEGYLNTLGRKQQRISLTAEDRTKLQYRLRGNNIHSVMLEGHIAISE